MIRSALGKVAWVGRTASMVFGLALVLALVFGVATMALAAVPGDPFRLGKLNTMSTITQLVGSRDGTLLRIANTSTGANAHALNLEVDKGNAPLKVSGGAGTAFNLSADKLDGLDSSDLQGPRAYAHINADGTLVASRSKNLDRSRKFGTGLYCLNSTVPPRNVVATIDTYGNGPGIISQASGVGLCSDSTGSYNIQVLTFSSGGAVADKAFDIAIN